MQIHNRRFLTHILVFAFILLPAIYVGAQVPLGEVQLQEIFLEGVKEKLLGNYEKAQERFQEVLQKDPGNDAASYELGRVYLLMEKDEEAIKAAEKAVQLSPENTWYKLFLGDLYQKTDRNEKGAELYESLSRSQPFNEEYALKRAFFLVRANQPKAALDVYDELEKRIGINEELTRRKHSLYLGMGDRKKAAKELEELVNAFPNITRYRHLLASYYQQNGEEKKARSTYKDILDLDPDDARAKLALNAATQANNPDIAFLESLHPIFADRNVDIDLKIGQLIPFLLKVTEEGAGPLADKTIEMSALLREVHPDKAKAWSVSADLYYYSGNLQEARELYEKTLDLDESVFAVWEQLLHTLSDLKEWQALRNRSEDALDLFPNQAILYFFSGQASFELQDYPRAADELNQASFMTSRIPSEHLNVLIMLGKTQGKLGHTDQSRSSFEKALSISPSDPYLLRAFAYSLAEAGIDLPKALEMASKAKELAPAHPLSNDTYGWVLYQEGKYQEALEWISKGFEQSRGERPRILEHMGDVLFRLDRVEEAVDYWEKALKESGNAPILEKKISERKIPE